MDIGSLVQVEKPFSLDLLHPKTKETLGVTLQILSVESDAVRQVSRRNADRLLEKRKPDVRSADLEAEFLDKAAASVQSWDWGEHTLGELDLKHSFENVRAVLQAHGWIYEQVAEASENRANFTSD